MFALETLWWVDGKLDRHHYADCPRHSLIVCAILVQNPVNLGGLCRTCESFRLEGLVVAQEAIVHNPVFRTVAASAHHWQPVTSCPPASLRQWLKQHQQNGYSLVALDAKPSAMPLTQFTFPVRSVLVLGRELTGIPADILAICDHIITIPQFGLVESLNVQTAAAIGIYEYIRQHPLA